MVGPLRYWEDLEVGQEFDCGSRRLSLHEIIGFAVDFDPQTFHIDPELARETHFGGVIASGLQTLSVAMSMLANSFLNPATSMGSPGFDELRWVKPVRPDDVLSLKLRILDKKPSRSRPEMGSSLFEWILTNQRDETVLTVKAINLIKRRPSTAAVATGGRAVKGIDHAVVVVRDLDDAQARYTRLGFNVQPRGRHARLGTANHLMIFERNYFELIGVVDPNEFNASRREWLSRTGGGLANIALATDGADLAHAAFAAAGLQPEPILDFGRMVDIDGKSEEAKFRTVRIPKAFSPILGFFVCDHLTPQFVYRAEWARHPNGATGLAGVTVIAAQPADMAGLCTKHFGSAAVRSVDDGLRIETGTQPIDYLTRTGFAARYPGLTIDRQDDHAALLSFRVPDPTKVAQILERAGATHIEAAGRVLVPASEACGVALEFASR